MYATEHLHCTPDEAVARLSKPGQLYEVLGYLMLKRKAEEATRR